VNALRLFADGRAWRLVAALAIAACAAAEDQPFRPFLVGWDAGGGSFPVAAGTPGELSGAVTLRYARGTIACARASFSLSPAGDGLLERADLLADPAAGDGGRVVVDTTAVRLPGIGFRGLLRPVSVRIERQRAATPDADAGARFLVHLESLGVFSGWLQATAGWTPFVGRAERAEAVFAGRVVDGRFGDLRLVSLRLLGGGDAASRAWLVELDRRRVSDPATVDLAAVIAPAPAGELALWTFRETSRELAIAFADDGAPTGPHGGADWTWDGVPSTALLPPGAREPSAR
jgi:hypothetical protein